MEKQLTILFFILAGLILLLILVNCSRLPVKNTQIKSLQHSSCLHFRSALPFMALFSNFPSSLRAGIRKKFYSVSSLFNNLPSLQSAINRMKTNPGIANVGLELLLFDY